MNKRITKKLKKIASELPPIPQRKPSDVKTGAQLIESGVEKTTDGKPIDPKKNYSGWQIAPMNHFDHLKKAYMKGGENAVSKYVGEAVRVFARLQKELREKEEQKKMEKVI